MTQLTTEKATDPLVSYRQYCQGQSDCKLGKSKQCDDEFYQLGYTEVLASKLNKGDVIYYYLELKEHCKTLVKAELHYKISNFFWHIQNIELIEKDSCNQELLVNKIKESSGSHFIHISKIKEVLKP